jgi:site-specific DNA-methyltransferase (adenine-specific)
MNHKYKNQDCLEFLKTLPDESVDLILTDPPYFIGYDGGKGWDSQWKSEQDYLDWCKCWSLECARVLKPNRMMCVFGTFKYNTFLRFKLEILEKLTNFHAQNEIIWSYNWGGRTKANFARKHEYIWCYSKDKTFLFNADNVRTERKQKVNMRTGEEYEKGTIPTCIWEKNNHTTSKEYCNWHPTQKPISILERFILAYTNPGDVVLDIFNGSASTMVACDNTGRIFNGCELDKEYYDMSIGRYVELTGKEFEIETEI